MMHNEDNLTPAPAEEFDSLLRKSKKLLSRLRKEITNGEGILDPNTQKKKELVARLDPIMKQLHEQWESLRREEEKARTSDNDSAFLSDEEPSPRTKITNIAKAKRKLSIVMQHFKDIITAITALTIGEKETKMRNQIAHFNQETEGFNHEIEILSREYALLKKNTVYIAHLEYGKDLSTYMTYGTATVKAIVTIGLAWFDTFGMAAKTAGAIFYPISAAFTTAANLFGFLGRTTQFFIARTEAERQESNELRKMELEDAKSLLRTSAMFRLLTFSLNLLSTLAFAGVLATPIGWAFVAAATLVDWIDEGLGTSQRADKALEDFKIKHKTTLAGFTTADLEIIRELNVLQEKADKVSEEGLAASQRANETLENFKAKHKTMLADLTTANPKIVQELNVLQEKADKAKDEGLRASQRANKVLQNFKAKHETTLANFPVDDLEIAQKFNILQEKADKARTEKRWGFANTVAMILIACGPIPFAGPIMGLAGLALFGVVAIRNTYVTVKPYVEKYLAAEEPKQENLEQPAEEKAHELSVELQAAPTQAQQKIRELLVSPATPAKSREITQGETEKSPAKKTRPLPVAPAKSWETSQASAVGIFSKAANDNISSPEGKMEIKAKPTLIAGKVEPDTKNVLKNPVTVRK